MTAGIVSVGLDCQLLYLDESTWTPLPDVIDLTVNTEIGSAEAKSRASRFAVNAPTLKDLSIDFGYLDRIRVGLDCRLYHNTGTHGSPVWVLIGAVRDSSLACETVKVDLSSRLSYWKHNGRGTKTMSADFQLVLDADDTAAASALRTAMLARDTIEYGFANGSVATSGTIMRRLPAPIITKFSQAQALEEGVMYDVSLKLANATNNPSVAKTGGGSDTTTYGILFDAWLADTDMIFAIVPNNLDITDPGTDYLTFTGGIFKFNETQPFTDIAKADVTIAPVNDSEPEYLTSS